FGTHLGLDLVEELSAPRAAVAELELHAAPVEVRWDAAPLASLVVRVVDLAGERHAHAGRARDADELDDRGDRSARHRDRVHAERLRPRDLWMAEVILHVDDQDHDLLRIETRKLELSDLVFGH